MIYTFIHVFLTLILGILPSFESSSSEAEDSTELKYVDISNDPILTAILTEAIDENRHIHYSSKENVNYFSLYIKEENGAIRCYVTAHTKKKLGNSNSRSGYTMIGSMPVIITNNSNYPLDISPNATKRFPMDPPNYPPYIYDPEEWWYVIKDKDFARFVWGVGWLWNKPLGTSTVRKNNKIRLTRPKRALKPRKY